MKKTLVILAALAIVTPLVALAQDSSGSSGYYSGSFTRLSYVQGNVYVQRGSDSYEQGEVNYVLVEGDKIGTKDGRVEIQLGRRNYLRLNDNSQVDFIGLPHQTGDVTKVNVLSGSVFVRIQTLDREKNFEIHTPDASFYVMEAGLYRVDIREGRQTEFSVYSGSAEAAGQEGSVLVGDRQRVTANDGQITSESVPLESWGDDFADWNENRDAAYAPRPSRTYLPTDYSDYENELAENGDWVNENDYGYVWVPRTVGYDWRPYYYGRWNWYPTIGWSWISSEPWGWCTSHYGRWGWRGGLGWYWIPRDHWSWGPAWVHWYSDGDYLGWCPLSYYDYPASIYNNVFYGRYSRGYFPNYSRTMTLIHRDQLQHRRISDVALGQAAVGRLGRISLRQMQPNVRPMVNSNGRVVSEARRALSRDNLRNVGSGFSANGRRLDSGSITRSQLGRDSQGSSSGRMEQRTVTRDSARSGLGIDSQRTIRSFPSRGISRNESSRPGTSGRAISPSRLGSSPSGRVNEGSVRGSSPSRGTIDRNTIRTYPSRNIRGEGRVTSFSSSSPRSGSQRSSSGAPARSFNSPSRNYSAPSRNSGSSSRNSNPSVSRYNSSPRSFSQPSRGSSPSTPRYNSSPRSYSAPSRSSSAPSRTFSPSTPRYNSSPRSYSQPSRSFSAPSRPSFSAPSRSYSAPSRSSSGSVSRSSSGSSSRGSGSSSGGRVTRKR